ncbi:hypothetical protein [Rubritalea tangerina]|uniref:hypothetical protein n=1 Tax=Rubritalea tangerina TaxID=430798 RepID=UPI0036175047
MDSAASHSCCAVENNPPPPSGTPCHSAPPPYSGEKHSPSTIAHTLLELPASRYA